MKIYISADIEGVTGVTHWDEANLTKEDSKAFREQMTAEVAAACKGALKAGATEVWVKDAHGSARNIDGSKLPHEARLIRGWSGHPYSMMGGLDETFHGVVFVGYHARAGAGTNPLEHTFSSSRFVRVKLNGAYASEFSINSYTAASLGVPVLFLSGDKGLCDEAEQLNSNIETVAVKEGIGACTVNIHPEIATARIQEAVATAVSGDLTRCRLVLPTHFRLEIQYRDHSEAYRHGFYPGAVQTDTSRVQYDTESYFEVLRFLSFAK